jgi:hypothetical protein
MQKQQGHRSIRAGQACKSPCHGLFASLILAVLFGLAGPAVAQESPAVSQQIQYSQTDRGDEVLQLAALDVRPFFPPVTAAVLPDSSAEQPDGPADEVRSYRVDGWGARHSPFMAGLEVVGINLVTWGLNHFIRDADFTRVYPRTWWENISGGFEYDRNLFSTNVMDHPLHGSLYHNAGRSNGLRFWSAVPYTIAGSLMWECCAETHPMALNDLVNTSLGGIALGEATYRLSSAVLDNEVGGAARFGRETAALVLNPIRGFNRMASGRAFEIMPNPVDPDERTPGFFSMRMDGGYRAVGSEGSLQSPSDGGFAAFHIDYGDPFGGRRGGAFDVFEMDVQLNFADRNLLGELAIRGNLLTRSLGQGDGAEHAWAVVQGFEFDNTNAYQYGSQTVSARLESRWPMSSSSEIRTRFQGGVTILGTLDSEFDFDGRVPIEGSLRNFEYGPGLDGRFEIEARAGRARLGASWRTTWLGTVNDTPVNGGEAVHWLHWGRATGLVPIGDRIAFGTDLSIFVRDSGYRLDGLIPARLTVPELRIYGSWALAD